MDRRCVRGRLVPLLAPLLALGAAWLPAADFAEVKSAGALRVVAGQGEQPEMFSFKSETEPGFEREMLEGFARLHKLKFEVHAVKHFEDRLPALLKGAGDVVIGLVDTPERRKQIAFTTEVIPARHVAVSCKPRPAVTTLEQFRGEKVGVLKATSWAQAAYDAGVPAAKAEAFTETEELLDALCAARIGATVMTVSDLTLAMKRRPGLEAGVAIGPGISAAWGIRKEDHELKAALDEYLANIHKSATWSRLVVKYFGRQALSVLGRAASP